MCCQAEGAVEPLVEQAFSYRKFLGGKWAMFVCGGRGDKASGGSIGVGRHFDKKSRHWSDHPAILAALAELFL
jgi:hypothetical protein